MTPMRVAVAISFLLFAAPLTAQSTFTGANWRGWSEAVRLMYVVGYADGRSSGFFETLRMMDEKRWSKAVREGAEKDPQLKSFSTEVTVGQLLEGVNKFFEDYRNLHIQLSSAVEIIHHEAAGNVVVTEEYLQAIRRIAARRGHK